MKPFEEMNKEERRQAVADYERQRREWIAKVPLLSPEQSAACRLPNEAELLAYLAAERRKTQDRLRRWVDQGGNPNDY